MLLPPKVLFGGGRGTTTFLERPLHPLTGTDNRLNTQIIKLITNAIKIAKAVSLHPAQTGILNTHPLPTNGPFAGYKCWLVP